MIRPWEKFGAVSSQVDIEYINVLRRSRGVLVAEIGTRQKYCEVLGWSGLELHLTASGRTPPSQRNTAEQASTVLFPRSVRGWHVIAPHQGRYSLAFTLYRPARRARVRNRMIPRTGEWRDAYILGITGDDWRDG